ncbi:MAG: hypothetical protein C5B54_02785 [Acidobacteria bacterium]|nr:MAG: hypothetical protein C5B54_02785 [Acidobacteriota bacterium]
MITGHNTDITYKGTIYHVQTEDKGRANPVIETLVYKGGEILDAKRTSYGTMLEDGSYEEKKIISMIEEQHRVMITEIRAGRYDKGSSTGPQRAIVDPLAEGIIDSKKSLDQVILDYLASEEEKEKLVLQLQGAHEFTEGEGCTLTIITKTSQEEPLKGTKIIVKIISTVKKPITIYEGKTDRNGVLMVEFVMPEFPDGNAAVLIQAFSDIGSDEIKQLIKKRKKVVTPRKKP